MLFLTQLETCYFFVLCSNQTAYESLPGVVFNLLRLVQTENRHKEHKCALLHESALKIANTQKVEVKFDQRQSSKNVHCVRGKTSEMFRSGHERHLSQDIRKV